MRDLFQEFDNTEIMPKLEEASARLDNAIQKLSETLSSGPRAEMASRVAGLADRLEATAQERDALKTDLEAFKGDQRKLSLALREAQENYAAAQVVNEAVAGRLDDAIGELKILLGK